MFYACNKTYWDLALIQFSVILILITMLCGNETLTFIQTKRQKGHKSIKNTKWCPKSYLNLLCPWHSVELTICLPNIAPGVVCIPSKWHHFKAYWMWLGNMSLSVHRVIARVMTFVPMFHSITMPQETLVNPNVLVVYFFEGSVISNGKMNCKIAQCSV